MVPKVPTNITINLDLPEYIDLQTVGNWTYITGGNRGIIVYHLGIDDFVAFDRVCTYHPEDGCRIVVDRSSNITARDSVCCGSEFSIIDGSVLQGPATLPLYQYTVDFNGGSILHIYN